MNVHSFLDSMSAVAQKPEDKRAKLLDAALELFETRGFDGVAVPEIAKEAGVATGTLYLYFKDKAALVNALYRHWKGAYNTAVLAPLPEGLGPREIFSLYWRRMTSFAQAHPRAMRFMDLHHHGAYLDAESRSLSRDYAQTAEAFVRQARARGAIRDIDPILIVALTWGAAAGLVKFAASGALTLDANSATAMEEALWRAIATGGSQV
jgi:TetR/AcrR family transcriptional regulator, repressor of fatR-cypB operon